MVTKETFYGKFKLSAFIALITVAIVILGSSVVKSNSTSELNNRTAADEIDISELNTPKEAPCFSGPTFNGGTK